MLHSGGWIPHRWELRRMSLHVLFIALLMNILSVGIAYLLYTFPLDEGKLEGTLFAIEHAAYFNSAALISILIEYPFLYIPTELPPVGLRVFRTLFIIGCSLTLVSATAFAVAVIRLLPLLSWDISRLAPYLSLSAIQAVVGLSIMLIGKKRFRSSTNSPLHKQHGPTPGAGQ